MAKIVVEIDTDSPDIKLNIDGQDILGASYICFSKWGEDKKPSVSIDIPGKMDNGLVTMFRYYSDSEEINSSIASILDTNTIPGFTGIPKLSNDIANYLSL
jgi:hypothetical protein